MALSYLHQCGHNSNWNLESLAADDCGNGLILSPVHMARASVEMLEHETRRQSLFDPQFYLPSSQKRKLHTYEFFPEIITGGFGTEDFAMHALAAAELCVDFQQAMAFRAIVIPTRYFNQMITDFCDKQDAYTVHPFLEVISGRRIDTPVYLTVVLTSHMIKDVAYRTMLLNWITSFPELDGVYLIAEFQRATKQVDDAEYLSQLLEMLVEIKKIGMHVIVGYQNTESLLCSLVPDVELTFGSFENTRMFSVDKFVESDEERRGPRARIYLPGLLNWVQLGHAKEIRDRAPAVWDEVYSPSDYSEAALLARVEPTFNQPGLYKHHFLCITQQAKTLAPMSPEQRYNHLRDRVRRALELYEILSEERIDLDTHGQGGHLDPWRMALNRHWAKFFKKK